MHRGVEEPRNETAEVGKGVVHGHTNDTKHAALSRVDIFPHKLEAEGDVLLETGHVRESLDESLCALPPEGIGGRIRSSERVGRVWRAWGLGRSAWATAAARS